MKILFLSLFLVLNFKVNAKEFNRCEWDIDFASEVCKKCDVEYSVPMVHFWNIKININFGYYNSKFGKLSEQETAKQIECFKKHCGYK